MYEQLRIIALIVMNVNSKAMGFISTKSSQLKNYLFTSNPASDMSRVLRSQISYQAKTPQIYYNARTEVAEYREVEEIEEVEKQILKSVKTPLERFFVSIKDGEQKIWTMSANTSSKNVPVVMVHGFCGGIALWIQNIDTLAEERPFYAMDLLGFGRSSRPAFSEDPVEAERQFVDSIEEWRKEMKIEQMILFGHSFGGYLATSYSLRFADRVKALILVDPWGFSENKLGNDSSQRDSLHALWLKAVSVVPQNVNPIDIFRASGQVGVTIFKYVRPNYHHHYADILADTDLVYRYIYLANAASPTGEQAFRAMSENYYFAKNPMIQRFESISSTIPIWFIHGGKSFIDPTASHEAKLKRINSNLTEVKVIDDGDHHVYASQASEFNAYVRDFLKDLDHRTAESSRDLE